MTNPSLFQRTADTRLRQRCIFDEYGNRCFRLADGSYVQVSWAEWEAIGEAYDEAVLPASAQLRRAFNLSMPFSLSLIALISSVPALDHAVKAADETIPIVIPFAILAGLPFTFMFRHYLAVRRALAAAGAHLRSRPRIAVTPAPGRAACEMLEILVRVLVGPVLLIQTVVTLLPSTFERTPFGGTRLGPVSVAAVAVLCAYLLLRRRIRRFEAARVQGAEAQRRRRPGQLSGEPAAPAWPGGFAPSPGP